MAVITHQIELPASLDPQSFLFSKSADSLNVSPIEQSLYNIGRLHDFCKVIMPRKETMPKPTKTRSLFEPPPFLKLPAEIRNQIYEAILQDAPWSLCQLLTVNRQVSMEAKPYIFRRQLIFTGQQKLFRWISKIDQQYLTNVVDLHFRLSDLDPSQIVGALGERLRVANISDMALVEGRARNPFIEACDLELQRLFQILKLFKNLKSLTILTIRRSDPRPSDCMLKRFAKHLDGILSSLAVSSLTIPSQVLQQVSFSAICHLQELRISGYPFNKPLEITSYAQQLPSLIKLEILQQDRNEASLSISPPVVPAPIPNRKKVAKILNCLPKLQELKLCMYSGQLDPREFSETTSDNLEEAFHALEKTGKSLRVLRILSHVLPWSEDEYSKLEAKMADFIEKSSLTHMEISCQFKAYLDRLPRTIRSITIAFYRPHGTYSHPQWFDLSEGLIKRLGDAKEAARYPNLEEISVTYPENPNPLLWHHQEFWTSAPRMLRRQGIRLSVHK